jgi:hypothetical protein
MRFFACYEIDAIRKMEGNTMNLESIRDKDNKIRNNLSTAYNDYKEFEGRKYTGVRVGGAHHWYYERGEWKEKKVAPDKWEFTYATNKRRAWNAPDGSGVPVGTEYHWYILAHQNVRKLDANVYTTSMDGLKYKLAHKRVGINRWSLTENAQREQLIKILEEYVIRLKREIVEEAATENLAPLVTPSSETLSL